MFLTTFRSVLAIGLLASCLALPAQAAPALIPAPASIVEGQGGYELKPYDLIAVADGDAEALRTALYLQDLLQETRGLSVAVREGGAGRAAITLKRDGPKGEAYRLSANPDGVVIAAADEAGLFYGAVTLWQLATQTPGKGPVRIQAMTIEDAPRFAWRGLMLDSARHFQSPAFVKRFIDWMALHKLNTLHWHLTDDQGWRLEIKKYPRLTEVGAWRVQAGAAPAADIDPATGRPRQYGGFYTQDQVREIVAYAAARQITIVPEIEMPGHAQATLVAYPDLGTVDPAPTAVSGDWGVFPYIYNVDDRTFSFLEDVLTEVMDLFPGQYIHVGGDEAVKDQWKASPSVQAKIKALGLKDEHELQSWFIQRIERFLNAKGRRLIGWDEILEGGLAPNATVMSWRGIDGAVAAARQGHDAVLAAQPTLYFDRRQSASPDEPPGRGQMVTLKDVYDFDPAPASLTADETRHVLGLQATLFSEHIRTEERMEQMAFPRAAAIAELGWSPARGRDWAGFSARLPAMLERYGTVGLRYDEVPLRVVVTAGLDVAANRTAVTLATPLGLGDIHYTLDGSAPTAASPLYVAPLDLPVPSTVKAAAFENRRALTAPTTKVLDAASLRFRKSQELKLCSEGIALSLEDDGPLEGPRAVMIADIMNPCWIYPAADLTGVTRIELDVGQRPFNFQIGADLAKITFRPPTTPEGEFEVRLDSCAGPVVATLPLAPAAGNTGVTRLTAPLAPASGLHDLCFTYTARGVEPMWFIDGVQIVPPAIAPARGP
ncbi:MAG: family 20 glycosylhydrolase [Caulobacter sp.]|nr:family 20 glycosylhydrolase [Caulobacter sp.]